MNTLPEGCTCTATLPDLYCPLHKAAPDLLAALKAALNYVPECKGKPGHTTENCWCVMFEGLAAIAKAEERP